MFLRSLCLLVPALILFLTTPVLASTHTWLGTRSDRISDAGNWSGGSPVGDPEAMLVFPNDAARFAVTNDVPGLPFQTLTFQDAPYVLSGERMLAADASIFGGYDETKLAVPLHIEGTLTVYGGSGVVGLELAGPISGPGGIYFSGSWVTMSGSESNTFEGPAVLSAARLQLKKSTGAIAIPGEVRAEATSSSSRLVIQAPEQIADTATVRWPSDSGDIRMGANETIGTLEAGTIHVSTIDDLLPTLTIGSLVVRGTVDFRPNVRFLQSTLEIPAGGAISFPDGGKPDFPAGGITLRGPGRVQWRAGYTAPTRIDGPEADLIIANSDVTLTSGIFNGEAKSIVATGGTLSGQVRSMSSIRLAPGVRVLNPLMHLHGPLDLAGASLMTGTSERDGPRLIIDNTSTEPVVGTFAGLAEDAIGENRYRISYRGGSGNDVTVIDLQKPRASVTITQPQKPGFVGEPVDFEVLVSGSGGVPAGTVSIRLWQSEQASITAPLIAGRATFSLTFDQFQYAQFAVEYSGDSTYASSSDGFTANVTYRKSVITSIDPPSAPVGGPVTVTLRGSYFYPRSQVGGIPVENLLFVSSTELRVTLNLTYAVQNTMFHITVFTVEGSVISDPVDFRVTAEDGPPSILSFDDRGAIASVTPGAKTVWIRTLADSQQPVFTATDDDRNGVVRWDWTFAPPPAVWSVVDVTSGNFAVRGHNGVRPELLPFPEHTFIRDGQGNASKFVLRLDEEASRVWRMLWVRPGAGAWMQTISDGNDADHLDNDIIFGSIDAMASLAGSPPHPAGFAAGDVVLLIPRGAVSSFFSGPVFAARLATQDLAEAPGILLAARRGWSFYEHELVKLPVIRIDGAAGTVSVQYTTVERTAEEGVHFQRTSGTVTFAPGETIQWIEVPLIDDDVYGGHHVFDVELSNPVTATLGEETAFVVGIKENDPVPRIRIDGAVRRQIVETDTPQTVMIALTLTGRTTLTATVEWQTDERPIRRGEVTFAPGETRKNISILIPGNDSVDGGSEILIDFAGGWTVEPRFVTLVLQDDESPQISANDVTVDEDAGTAQMTLTIPAARTQLFRVYYETRNTTAVAPADYTRTSESVAFNAGQTQATITIPIVDDALTEGDESFDVELQDFASQLTYDRPIIHVVIVDDEVTTRPAVSIDDVQVTEPEGGLTAAELTVRLSAASTRTVTVHYQTVDGTAAGGLDYARIASAVVFAPGETVKTVAVGVFGDTRVESEETFRVKLGSALNATVLDDSGTATIVDNDKGRRRAVGK